MTPMAALRPCASPNCGALVRGVARCPVHARQKERQRPNTEDRRLYDTARWHRLRALVLAQEPLCGDCAAKGETTASREVHHKQRHAGDVGLFFARENLTALCGTCHKRRTARGE